PSLVEIIQQDEREAKLISNDPARRKDRDKPARKGRRSANVPIAEQSSPVDDLIKAIFLSQLGTLDDWTEKYCTARQHRCIVERFVNEKTVEAIAELEGISHQAVSRAIHTGIRRIFEGLQRDKGIVPQDIE